MAIYELLQELKDVRKESDRCEFNGYLEDYLETADAGSCEMKEIFHKIFELNSDLKICVGLRSEINKQVISNQIIRYKDAFKLQGSPVIVPYIIYGSQDDTDRALILCGCEERGYLFAKGLYYCLTEPYSEFADCKNDIVAMNADSQSHVVEVMSKLFDHKAGALQREIDRQCFTNYEQLKKDALDEAAMMKEAATETIKNAEAKEAVIYDYVVRWFLLKKVVYVQYMVNKDILQKEHEGNVKKQRNQAKINADEIPFISYSELWRSI